jgi:hypothetical protein
MARLATNRSFSERTPACTSRSAKIELIKVVLVGKQHSQRFKEVCNHRQTIVAASSKEGIVGAFKTAIKHQGDIYCYDFARYGLVRDDEAAGVVYKGKPNVTPGAECRGAGQASGQDQESTASDKESDTDSDSEAEEDGAGYHNTIPLKDVADACRDWTDHAVCYLTLNVT